jgi:hypothetical protein
MNMLPPPNTRRSGLRLISQARALLAVSVLAALAVPTRSLAQTPTFNAVVTTYTNVGSGFPDNATVGDINGDGKLDAIVTGGDNPNIMHVMLGNGDGTFADHGVQLPQVTTSNVSNLAPSLVGFLPVNVGGFGQVQAIDVNHDGKLDLVTIETVGINYVNYSFIGVLINTGNDVNGVPQFTATHYYVPILGARTLTLGDLNGDGAPDLTLGFGSNGIYVWLNNGSGGFAPSQVYYLTPGAGGPAVGQAVIADLNGDGKADYVVTSNQNGGANIFFGNGDGTLQAPVYLPNGAVSVAVADVNGDGKPDLLMGGSLTSSVGSEGLMVYLNNGGGSFGAPTLFAIPGLNGGFSGSGSVAVADINGDGKLDAVLSNLSNNTVAVMLGDGNGGFGTTSTFAANFWPTNVFVGDFTGDSKPDIGVVLRNQRVFGVLTNTTPAPTVAAITPITTISAPVITVPANITVTTTTSSAAVSFSATATSTISSEIFSRKTGAGEPWKAYSVVFKPTISGNFKLRFRTVSDDGSDNTFFIDDVHVIANATNTELFHSGFEQPTVTDYQYVSWLGSSLLSNQPFGDWTFTNYSGVINGSSGAWGGSGPQEGSQRGLVQSFQGTLSNITSASSIALVAGQTYTVKFYQATRLDYTDNLTYAVTLESSETNVVTASPASGSTFPIGNNTVTLSATNSAGTSSSASFQITVKQSDVTPPVITKPADIVAEATGPNGAAVAFTATATDNVDGNVTVVANPDSGSIFPLTAPGPVTIVGLAAADKAGNTASATFKITVRDTTGPVITAPDVVVEASGDEDGTKATFTVTALDAVSGVRPVTLSRSSGSKFPLGVTTVTATSKDALGNTTTKTFTVTVRDTTPPKLSVPKNISVSTSSATGTKVTFQAEAEDTVSKKVTITYSPASGSNFPIGTTVVTVTAKDAAGNTAKGTFTVTVTLKKPGEKDDSSSSGDNPDDGSSSDKGKKDS